MTVVHFGSARDKMRWKLPQCWQSEETAELMRLYAVLNERSVVTSYEYGETERREPQFYLISADPAEDCIRCVSRILKDGRPWYVIEDGFGGLLAEGCSLSILVSHASRCWRSLRSHLVAVVSFFGELLTRDGFAADSFEIVMTSSSLALC
jgi:hypothetical protein